MGVVQRKAFLRKDGFIQHKKNPKGTTTIWSRNHPTAKFVRVVVDSGIGKRAGTIVRNPTVKLCYINRQKNWREITTPVSSPYIGLATTIANVEAAEKFVKTCKHCKAKKFTAKTGNVVCSNACWTAWGGKKKSANTTKKSSQKSTTPPKGSILGGPVKKKSQKVVGAGHPPYYPSRKSSEKKAQKKLQKIVAEILPGDLVTMERVELDKVKEDYTGKILGIVLKVDPRGKIATDWTVDKSGLPEWDLPNENYYLAGRRLVYRFKVLSRKAEWTKAA